MLNPSTSPHPSPSKDDEQETPIPDWQPTPDIIARANVTLLATELGLADYAALHCWSIEHREAYWQKVIERLKIRFAAPPAAIVDLAQPTRPRWLPGARLNIVNSCFNADDAQPAIISGNAAALHTTTYGQLKTMTACFARSLAAAGVKPGDAVAILMPMTPQAVAAYLGVIAAGAAVVSIADSFSPREIAARLRISDAKLVITQALVPWGDKHLPLYEKAVAAGAARAIVFDAGRITLRAGDSAADAFFTCHGTLDPVIRDPQDAINILFSSGTTGDPKAIPWDHTTPLKCAADAHFHHDLHAGEDILCWPTSLGWMMGPWAVLATLLNRCTLALFEGSPTGRPFGAFVQAARVTMLGLVPSLVRAWKASACMEGLDWSAIRAFSSTGECSNPGDMRYLMSLAGDKPVIEYCGGTEIGGAYVTSTVVQPSIASTFTTPALGIDLVLLDDDFKSADKGEVYLVGPSMGLSTRLLNRDNDAVYFRHSPAGPDFGFGGLPLRKHGDELERLPGNRYRVAGRSDDTMNLGGIKVGCAEIERLVDQLPAVHTCAAVADSPPDGGPSRLVLFVVPAAPDADADDIKRHAQHLIREQLNPLFRIDSVHLVDSFPRTASNKVMRRVLRDRLKK